MTNVLAISGNDIFSGGGLHADLNTYQASGLHGFVAVTCLTAVTDNGFEVFATDSQIFAHQLTSLKDVDFAGIKLGLLPNVDLAQQALNFIKDHPGIPVVLDPVLVCKEKHDIAVSDLLDELLKFLPYVTIVTPNLVEAEILTQMTIESVDDMIVAAKKLYDLGAQAVVVKGGKRLSENKAIDVYYDGQGSKILEASLLEENNIGAGCTFASAIASRLVKGAIPQEAVEAAKAFVHQAIKHSDQYGVRQVYDQE